MPVDTTELLDAAAKLEPPGGGGASEMSLLMHTILPTWTVFVDRKLGVVESKVRPDLPVPSGCLKGVQLMLVTGTPTAETR